MTAPGDAARAESERIMAAMLSAADEWTAIAVGLPSAADADGHDGSESPDSAH